MNLVMTTMISARDDLAESRTSLTIGEGIVYLFDCMAATTTYKNPTLLRYFRNTPSLIADPAAHAAFVTSYDNLLAAPTDNEKTATMILFIVYYN